MTGRPKDRMGIGGWYTGLSDKYVDTLDDFGIGVRDAYGLEIYYNFEINPWLHFTADFQAVENSHKGDDTVIIPGFWLVMSF